MICYGGVNLQGKEITKFDQYYDFLASFVNNELTTLLEKKLKVSQHLTLRKELNRVYKE